MTLDYEKIDSLITTNTSYGNGRLPSLSNSSALVVNFQNVKTIIENNYHALQEKNPVRYSKGVKVVEKEIEVPRGGRVGAFFGWTTTVTEENAEEYIHEKDLQESMDVVVQNVKSVSASLQIAAKSLREEVKVRDKVITSMEGTGSTYNHLFTDLSKDYDGNVEELSNSCKQLDAIEDYLGSNDHNQVDFAENLDRKDGLEAKIQRCKQNSDLIIQRKNDVSTLKGNNQTALLNYIDVNRSLMIYVQLAEATSEYVAQNIRDGEMSSKSYFLLSNLFLEFADTSKQMITLNNFGAEVQTKLRDLLSLCTGGNKKQLTTAQ